MTMFLKKDKRPNGRIHLSIVEGYRDPLTGRPKQRNVQTLGYLDELEKKFNNPILHFSEIAKKMTEEEKQNTHPLTFSFRLNEIIDSSTTLRKNLGFVVLSYFYHKLGIDGFLINRQRNLNIEFSLNNIFQLLVYSRVLNPCSKKEAFETKDDLFMDLDIGINDVYRSLDHFKRYKDDLLLHLHEMIRIHYGRDTNKVYYDVTNYYFEIKEPDDLRKKGVSKENKKNPIIQMGLLMDNNGLPITYRLFEGNTNDCETLMPVLDNLKDDYALGKIIVVADKGMNTGENIAYNILKKNGYIYSQTIRGGTDEFKKYVLDQSGYIIHDDGFKIKSRVVSVKINVTNTEDKTKKVDIIQKQVVFYSPDFAKRAGHEREKAIEKARKLMSISKNGKLPEKGAAKYIKSQSLDKKTGEIFELSEVHWIDSNRIAEECKYDGYYAIVTSELDMPNEEILDAYRSLWKIEESFKITKTELKTRPVNVSTPEHIEAHFLTCFIALLLIRLLQLSTDNKYSTRILVNELNKISGTYLDKNYYMLDYYSDIVKEFESITGTDFSKRFMTLGEIKKIIANVKR
ncbi:IS1634 family transposase [Sedimentibacter hydroxybenzoicus DSM 7310]|uniref:IS1634 family transposase n=2 Tax=Sedimentibacter hydroxybenzoicus TaxID=29345 RepID=A0A974BKK8_SEDHY|nr:IS1634 family transposase [Sedimentibacter hydroxybenzoicus DSM 7310]